MLFIKDNPDGTCDIDIEMTKQEKEIIRKVYGRKRFTDKLLRQIFTNAVGNLEKKFRKKGYKLKFNLIPKEKK